MTDTLHVDTDRMADLYARYRSLHDRPAVCRPMVIVDTPCPQTPTWAQQLSDPLVMLQSQLELLRPHLEMGDDRVPTVRVQFGTMQVAAAFGCPVQILENSLPAATGSVLEHAESVADLSVPGLDAGWYGKLAEWTEVWKRNLPSGVHIQHPDIQSPFNNAHLIRGNDILTDFFDAPEHVDMLLDKVTDFMIAVTRHVRAMITDDPEWFFDWGVLWRGSARISNCTMQMISPELYREHVLPRDARFLRTVGGGRIHYCGLTGAVIDDFVRIPEVSGLDVDQAVHSFYDLCRQVPERIVLFTPGALGSESPEVRRMLAGDWPEKRNMVVQVSAPSVEAGKRLLDALRSSMPY